MLKNNENSVLFSIGSVIELQHQKERELHAERRRHKDEQERAASARLAQSRRSAERTEQARLADAAQSARQDWETQVADKEAAIRTRIEADTQRELAMLRAEYRDGAPVVVPGRHRLSYAVASLVTLAIFGLGAFGAHAMANGEQSPTASTATATTATARATAPHATEVAPEPELKTPAPTPKPTVHQPKPVVVKVKKPARKKIAKPRPIRRRPRCKWITTTKRVQNPLWNHPLNFEGRYKIIKKRVKKCRK